MLLLEVSDMMLWEAFWGDGEIGLGLDEMFIRVINSYIITMDVG